MTEDFKNAGDLIYVLSGSTAQWKKYFHATQKKLIASAISIGRGGVEVALAKAAIGGMLGYHVARSMKHETGIIFSANPKTKISFGKRIGTVTKTFDKKLYNAYHATFKNY